MDETSKENHTKNTPCSFCRANEVLDGNSCLPVRKGSRVGKRSSADKRRSIKDLYENEDIR